jgi:hypothetical protein
MKQCATLTTAIALMGVMTAALLATPRPAHAQGSATRLQYLDTEGAGELDLSIGDLVDRATGGLPISVHISQNGATYAGSGFEVPLSQAANGQQVDLVVFTIVDGNGDAYLFRGRITVPPHGTNGGIGGGGAFQAVGSPGEEDWSVSSF